MIEGAVAGEENDDHAASVPDLPECVNGAGARTPAGPAVSPRRRGPAAGAAPRAGPAEPSRAGWTAAMGSSSEHVDLPATLNLLHDAGRVRPHA
jgi:hypothetical protein